MKIVVTILPENKKQNIEVDKGIIISDLLKKIGLKPDTLIVMNENQPIPIDEALNEDLELKIIQVASGG